MRNVLLTILTLLTIESFGQQWAEYKVDDNLTLSIPDNFEVIDTLGQHIIRAQIDNALVMIQRIPNKGEQATNIRDKDDLLENYKGFQKGFIGSQQGKLMSQEFAERDGLQLTQFAYYATMGEEKQIRHCLGIFINENWYAIQFWEVEAMTNELSKDRETLFTSVKFPAGQSLKNQMSTSVKGSHGYNVGYLIGTVLGYILIPGLLITLVIWVSKKARGKSTNAQQKL